jgi:hypothetical protein
MRDSSGISGTGETLKSGTSECGSPHAPRKASNLERKSTTPKYIKKRELIFQDQTLFKMSIC